MLLYSHLYYSVCLSCRSTRYHSFLSFSHSLLRFTRVYLLSLHVLVFIVYLSCTGHSIITYLLLYVLLLYPIFYPVVYCLCSTIVLIICYLSIYLVPSVLILYSIISTYGLIRIIYHLIVCSLVCVSGLSLYYCT